MPSAPARLAREEIEREVNSVPLLLALHRNRRRVTTPGNSEPDERQHRIVSALPDLRGKSVLNVAAWDGFFSFEAERLGAGRVVALDHLAWELDIAACMAHWRECNERGVKAEAGLPERFHGPAELLGKRGLDTARRLLGSRVESVMANFMETDLDALGTFDVVLFLGLKT